MLYCVVVSHNDMLAHVDANIYVDSETAYINTYRFFKDTILKYDYKKNMSNLTEENILKFYNDYCKNNNLLVYIFSFYKNFKNFVILTDSIEVLDSAIDSEAVTRLHVSMIISSIHHDNKLNKYIDCADLLYRYEDLSFNHLNVSILDFTSDRRKG